MLKVEYNVNFHPRPRNGKYTAEKQTINEFIASEHENVCFSYSTYNKAKNACQSIMWYAKTHKKPIRAMQRDCKMIVVKTN